MNFSKAKFYDIVAEFLNKLSRIPAFIKLKS